MKKRYPAIFSLLVAAVFIFFGSHQATLSQPAAVHFAQTAVVYDTSIATEYGKPIKVVRVIDGDTVELINGQTLRYIGMDTPEEVDPKKSVQCYAKEAAQRNKELVEGKEIIFYNDVSAKDKYGRWLGFVYLPDGTFINKELVSEGYAFAYPYAPDTSLKKEFAAAEVSAKSANLGLWKMCSVSKLTSGKKQTNIVQ